MQIHLNALIKELESNGGSLSLLKDSCTRLELARALQALPPKEAAKIKNIITATIKSIKIKFDNKIIERALFSLNDTENKVHIRLVTLARAIIEDNFVRAEQELNDVQTEDLVGLETREQSRWIIDLKANSVKSLNHNSKYDQQILEKNQRYEQSVKEMNNV